MSAGANDRRPLKWRPAKIPASPSHADLEVARLLLQRLGVSPQDLLEPPGGLSPVPSFAEYIPVVSAAVSLGTRRVYSYYWNRVLEHWAQRRLDEPRPTEIKELAEHVKAHVVQRRNARGGRCAMEHLIGSLRCIYNHAVADGLLSEADDPARRVPLPPRLPSTRRALSAELLAEINQIAATTGNDPELDTLVLRLHIQTACRREGVLALRPVDLDPDHCLVLLREKAGTVRWQPVAPSLMTDLVEHAGRRRSPEDGSLLRYRNGKPIGRRRYDHLWTRLGKHIPLVAKHQITAHWLRHTTLTWVERNFGYAVAKAYAGHNDRRDDAGTTATYVRADLDEVASALAVLTGEAHPLSRSGVQHSHLPRGLTPEP